MAVKQEDRWTFRQLDDGDYYLIALADLPRWRELVKRNDWAQLSREFGHTRVGDIEDFTFTDPCDE